MWTVTTAYLAALAALISAQPPDCSELGFGGRAQPISGERLPICRTTDAQCCSVDYLEDVREKVEQRLQRFLRREFEDVIDDYEDELENLIEYFTEYFPQRLLENLPFSDNFLTEQIIRRILRNFVDNLEIFDIDIDSRSRSRSRDRSRSSDRSDSSDDGFNVGEFLEELLDNVIRIIARIFRRNGATERCIARVLRSELDESVVGRLTSDLQQVRRAITALIRIGRFLERQSDRFEAARFLEQCVSRFVELAFCGRCTGRLPPLCFSTCNALVRGCYAPYYTALNRQYGELWNQVQMIIDRLNATLGEVALGENALFNITNVVREIREECGIRMTGTDSRSRRSDTSGRRGPMRSESTSETSATNSSASGSGSGEEEETRTRTGSRTGMSSRTGTSRTSGRSRTSKTGTSRRTGDTTGDSDSSLIVLDEFDDGVETDGTFIPFNVVDDLLTFNGAFEYGRRGLRFCLDALYDDVDSDACVPPDLLDDDKRFCRGTDICTSQCYCFDGSNIVRDNETSHDFDLDDSDSQGNNPVYTVSADDMRDEVDRIANMGNDVSAFLNSAEFTSVDPNAIRDEVPPDDGDDDEESASAAGPGASLCTLILAAIMTKLHY